MSDFEWDPEKARLNLSHHGVRFAEAAVALEDPFALSIADPFAEGEGRFIALVADPQGRVLVVVYSHGDSNTRIISARRASPGERAQYRLARRHA